VNAPAQIRQDAALSPAQTLWDLTGEDMGAVDALILERMQSSVGLIPDLAESNSSILRLSSMMMLWTKAPCAAGKSLRI